VAETNLALVMYFIYQLAENQITAVGILRLPSANLKQLKVLSLSIFIAT